MTKKRTILIGLGLLVVAAIAVWLTPKVLRRLDMQGLRPVTVAKGLENPWSLAFLPDGRMLVTERPGRMRIVTPDGRLGEPLPGLLPVAAGDEGGLLDVTLDPGFAANRTIFWTFSEPAADSVELRSTAVARGRLVDDRIVDARVIFRQEEKSKDGSHFGSRLVFGPDGSLFVGLGDRGSRPQVQRLDSAYGKILRIDRDGNAAVGNPFLAQPGALGHIWAVGLRNVQAMTFHPDSGELWAADHGPQGGDELNVIRPGRNYGWPVITYGTEYADGAKIGEGTAKDGMEQPVARWVPISIAPSGMTFLTSDRYPEWKGQLFMGNLRGRALLRVKLDGHRVVEEQRLVTGLLERIRDVRQGPDGWLYIITHHPEGRIIRVER